MPASNFSSRSHATIACPISRLGSAGEIESTLSRSAVTAWATGKREPSFRVWVQVRESACPATLTNIQWRADACDPGSILFFQRFADGKSDGEIYERYLAASPCAVLVTNQMLDCFDAMPGKGIYVTRPGDWAETVRRFCEDRLEAGLAMTIDARAMPHFSRRGSHPSRPARKSPRKAGFVELHWCRK